MKNNYQFFFLIFLFTFNFQTKAQYADKSYYLIDSLQIQTLSPKDKSGIDSCLKLFHFAKSDTARLYALSQLIDVCADEKIWPVYNLYMLNLANKNLSENNSEQVKTKLMMFKSGAYSNMGIYHNSHGDPEKALDYYRRSLNIEKEIENKQGIVIALNNVAAVHRAYGENALAFSLLEKSLIILEEIKKEDPNSVSNIKTTALVMNNIGAIYDAQGDVKNALVYYFQGLKIREEIEQMLPLDMQNKKGKAASLNNIGLIYEVQGDVPLALNYFNKTMVIQEEIRDKKGIANTYNNIGFLYYKQNDIQSAVEHFEKSLKLRIDIGDTRGIGMSLNNLAALYKNMGDFDKSLDYFNKSLQINEDQGDKSGVALSLNNIGAVLFAMDRLIESKEYAQNSLKLAQLLKSPERQGRAAKLLYDIAKREKNYVEALINYELYIQMRDSLNNEETQKASIRQQTKYEFEKAQLIKEQEAKDLARLMAEKVERRNNLQYSVIFMSLLFLFAVVLSLGFIKLSPKVAEGLIFFSFLILFEFILVLADPYIDKWTGGAPGLKLLFNAVLAAMIFPIHAFFEKFLKQRMINSKIKDGAKRNT